MSEADDDPAIFTVCREPGGKWGVRVGSTRGGHGVLEHLTAEENLRWVDALRRANGLNAEPKGAAGGGAAAAQILKGWFRSKVPKTARAVPWEVARLPEALTAFGRLRRIMDDLLKEGEPGQERMDELRAGRTPR